MFCLFHTPKRSDQYFLDLLQKLPLTQQKYPELVKKTPITFKAKYDCHGQNACRDACLYIYFNGWGISTRET